MPLYAAVYQTACLTRQALEQLAHQVATAGGPCQSQRYYCSLSGGRLLWLFEAPNRDELERWLKERNLENFEWLVRVDYTGEDEHIREV